MKSFRWLIILGGIIAIAYFTGVLDTGYHWMQETVREFTGADVWKENEGLVEGE